MYGVLAHGHTPARVHEQWIDAAMAVISGQARTRKLLIVAPPGHAKSTWLSLILPPWYLGRHPDHRYQGVLRSLVKILGGYDVTLQNLTMIDICEHARAA